MIIMTNVKWHSCIICVAHKCYFSLIIIIIIMATTRMLCGEFLCKEAILSCLCNVCVVMLK